MAARMEEVSIALLGRVQRAGPVGYAGIVAAFLVWVLVRAHQPLAPSQRRSPLTARRLGAVLAADDAAGDRDFVRLRPAAGAAGQRLREDRRLGPRLPRLQGCRQAEGLAGA